MSYTRYAKWKWQSIYNIVGLTRTTFMQVSPTLRFLRKSGLEKNVLKLLKWSGAIETPLEEPIYHHSQYSTTIRTRMGKLSFEQIWAS